MEGRQQEPLPSEPSPDQNQLQQQYSEDETDVESDLNISPIRKGFRTGLDEEEEEDGLSEEAVDPMEPRFTIVDHDRFYKGASSRVSDFVLRYIPVAGLPEQFSERYLLRTVERKYEIKTLIVITMYNEEPSELERTLKGVCRNLDIFVQQLGPSAWKQFEIVIVSDGRRICNPATLEYLSGLGLFNGDHMLEALEVSDQISMHIFESTVVLKDSVMSNHKPLQVIFALKEDNGGKLDSHRWFFNAFAAQTQPKYTFLLDVGTKPSRDAIWKLFEAMEEDEHVGGCCGEITTLGMAHINPWVAAQQFEYKIATVLDKAMESYFGFISVLPGAFSAYRYEAIEGFPLGKYFKQINTPVKDLGPFQGNMYLAEDRILCFEVLAHKDAAWTLRYIKNATAATDVPEKLTSLIRQRRRWLNGSLFATVYVIANFNQFWRASTHSLRFKLLVSVLFTFYAASLVLTFFLPANFYLMFHFAAANASNDAFVFDMLKGVFYFITVIQIVLAMGNKPHQMELMYFMSALGYGVFFFFTIGLSMKYIFTVTHIGGNETILSTSSIASIGTLGTYLVSALLHQELLPVLTSMLQYFFMLPTFLVSFPIYSFCNIHDISWGTKGVETTVSHKTNRLEREVAEAELDRRRKEQRETESEFKIFRSYLVIGWVSTNCIYAALIMTITSSKSLTTYLDAMLVIFFGFNMFRLIFSTLFIFSRWWSSLRKKCRRGGRAQPRQMDSRPRAPAPLADPASLPV